MGSQKQTSSALLLLLASCALIGSIRCGDIDTTFCNTENLPNVTIVFPMVNATSKFQVSVERNVANRHSTEEIQEFFDGVRNMGLSIVLFQGSKTYIYSYYDTDELIIVQNATCKVLKLSERFDMSNFDVTKVDGKEHIISGLGLMIKKHLFDFKYLGTNTLRGIPVKEWQACMYSDKDQSTQKITYSISDDTIWTPAVAGMTFMPVQYKVESKSKTSGDLNTDIHIFTQFRNDISINEENFNTPSGVYCPGRQSTKPLPDVPSSFSFISHLAVSEAGTNDFSGSMNALMIDVDYDQNLARYDTYTNGVRFTEVHDYDTGLNYRINRYTGNCSVYFLNMNTNNPEATRPMEFFQFDRKPDFQYVGQRKVRGINTDVWSAPRVYNGLDVVMEWHFMADGWKIQETFAVESNEPVLLKMNYRTPEPVESEQQLLTPIFHHIADFDRTRINLLDFDVSDCFEVEAKKNIRFEIHSDQYQAMKQSQYDVTNAIYSTIRQMTGDLKPIRVAKLKTVYDNGVVYVIVTILEKPNKIGNPNRKNDDISMTDAIAKLEQAINSNLFQFAFADRQNKVYTILAKPNTLQQLNSENGRFVFDQSERMYGYTGGAVTGFVFAFLFVGIVAGFLAGIFLIMKKQSFPTLSSFNPNYKADPNA